MIVALETLSKQKFRLLLSIGTVHLLPHILYRHLHCILGEVIKLSPGQIVVVVTV